MQPSKALKRFTEDLSVGQSKPMGGFLKDMVAGIAMSHSAMLSDIGRTLGEDAKLITTEMRLSRNLVNANLDEAAIRERYLNAVEPFMADVVVALDFSEIRKDYAEKQEWLCDIWDNSKKEKARGYWLLNIEAIDKDGHHFPLWLEPFSQDAPGYESQAHVVKHGLQQVSPHVGKACVWVLDRGFDGANYIAMLEEAKLIYCIRQVGKRTIATEDGQQGSTAAIAEAMPTPHTGRWQNKDKGRESPISFSYGSALVTFPKDGKQRRLIVVRRGNIKPMMLLTNSLSDSPASVLRAIIAYLKRWGIEEGTRLVKQIFELENVRAMSFAGIRRLTLFASLSYGFLCLFAKRVGKAAINSVLRLYKSFGDTPHFIYYQLAKAVSMELFRGGHEGSPGSISGACKSLAS